MRDQDNGDRGGWEEGTGEGATDRMGIEGMGYRDDGIQRRGRYQ